MSRGEGMLVRKGRERWRERGGIVVTKGEGMLASEKNGEGMATSEKNGEGMAQMVTRECREGEVKGQRGGGPTFVNRKTLNAPRELFYSFFTKY